MTFLTFTAEQNILPVWSMEPIPMVLTIPILAHPLRLSHILRIALPLFSTPPRPIPTVHTHSSIPRLLIRHQCPHTPIGPLRTVLSTIRHLLGIPAQAVRSI